MASGSSRPRGPPTMSILVRNSWLALAFCAAAGIARGDIYQWEYVNPANPSLGKKASQTLCPDGAGIDAVPGAYFGSRDLTKAYLSGADLTRLTVNGNLTDAD